MDQANLNRDRPEGFALKSRCEETSETGVGSVHGSRTDDSRATDERYQSGRDRQTDGSFAAGGLRGDSSDLLQVGSEQHGPVDAVGCRERLGRTASAGAPG